MTLSETRSTARLLDGTVTILRSSLIFTRYCVVVLLIRQMCFDKSIWDKQATSDLINVLSQLVLLVKVDVDTGHEAAVTESAVQANHYPSLLTLAPTQHGEKIDRHEVAKIAAEDKENNKGEGGKSSEDAGGSHTEVSNAERRGNGHEGNPNTHAQGAILHPQSKETQVHERENGGRQPIQKGSKEPRTLRSRAIAHREPGSSF